MEEVDIFGTIIVIIVRKFSDFGAISITDIFLSSQFICFILCVRYSGRNLPEMVFSTIIY